jgi:hypothetical protein
MDEMNDAHACEMQCNYGSQTPGVLHAMFLIFMSLSSIQCKVSYFIAVNKTFVDRIHPYFNLAVISWSPQTELNNQ